MMKRSGYRTAYFGKWHLGRSETHGPDKQGYDESVVYNGGGFYGYGERMYPPQDFPKGKVLSEALTDLSLEFIEENAENPFFLFLAHYDVHVQLDADTAMIEKYMDKELVKDYPCNVVYAAMVENIDISVGRIMSKLEDLGLQEETLVCFFSDNGGLISRFDKIPLHAKSKLYIYGPDSMQYIATSNTPLRAEKGTVFEGGIREPMIVKWPGVTRPGSVSNDIISSVDFYPTLAEIVGADLPAAQVFDGKSIVEELQGKPVEQDRAVFWHYPVYHHGVPASAVRKGDWKLIHFLDDDHMELYNLAADIGEKHDLSSEEPEKADELMHVLESWRQQIGAEMPVPNPDFDASRRDEWGRHPARL
jgi:uncharacterized sulfatase